MFKRIYSLSYFKYIVALLYAFIFSKGYQIYLHETYLYAGFDIIPGRTSNVFLEVYSYLAAIFPIFFFRGVRKISSFICIFIYFVLYIPIIITFYLGSEASVFEVGFIQFLFLCGMSLLFLADRIPVTKNFNLPARINIPRMSLIFTWLGTAYIAFVYRSNLKFSSYEDVYIQRSLNAGLGDDVFTAYFGAFFANVFIPFSAAYGLFAKKKIYFLSAVCGSVIFFMATADKAILLFPFIIFSLYYFLKNRSLKNAFSSIGLGLIAIMLVSLYFMNSLFTSLFWMRTIGNGGMLTNYYHKFFESHPHTYLSHVNIVNLISGVYPYGDLSLGQVVGKHYWSYYMNANANFWATDGFAGFGTVGILISSVLFFFIFILFNKVTLGYNKVFIICILVPYLTILLNQSLFSSLVTGGGFLIMLFLSFKTTFNNQYIHESTNNNRSQATIYKSRSFKQKYSPR